MGNIKQIIDRCRHGSDFYAAENFQKKLNIVKKWNIIKIIGGIKDMDTRDYDLQKINGVLRKILRHEPELAGLKLDKAGWANVNDLLNGMNKIGIAVNLEKLQAIADANKRYSFCNKGHLKMRANYGHSLGIALKDLIGESSMPPQILYHQTQIHALKSILMSGIKKQKRDHVFLKVNKDIALDRIKYDDQESIILVIAANRMAQDGNLFYDAYDGVWLTDHVPAKYIINMIRNQKAMITDLNYRR